MREAGLSQISVRRLMFGACNVHVGVKARNGAPAQP
jgi:hypothetical protein